MATWAAGAMAAVSGGRPQQEQADMTASGAADGRRGPDGGVPCSIMSSAPLRVEFGSLILLFSALL
jgi:hypothetical protein